MEREQILEIIKQHIKDLMPELSELNINTTDSLRELGADSITRAEIIVLTISQLNLKLPSIAFSQAKNIGDIADICCQAISVKV